MIFKGTCIAMVTPFDNNEELDEEGMRANINFLIENGVDGLLAAGTTGESATITHEEQRRMVEILVDEVDGRVKTIAGAGSNSTKEALNLTKSAEEIGADFALVITPYYNKPQQHGLINHYKLLNDETNIPIIAYNVPSRTGTDISSETILEIAKLDNLVGLKEANPDLDKVSKTQKLLMDNGLDKKFTIISGNDNLTLPMISLGATGVISVLGNVDPRRMSNLVNEALAGNYDKAKEIHYELFDLMKVLFIESNPVPSKYALKLMNKPSGIVKMPLAPLKDESKAKVKAVLEELDLI